jgi:hypothetical protein
MQFLDDSAVIPLDLEMRCLLQRYQIWTQDAIHNLRSAHEPGALALCSLPVGRVGYEGR